MLGSPSKLTRIFSNLLQNSVDALTHSPGHTPCIRVSGANKQERICIRVSDNGPGIPERIRKIIFDPFVTAGTKSGYGLGLPIVRRLAQLHGGDVLLEEPEQGACFCVHGLPAAPPSGDPA